jgi:uncharacterized protein YceK
MRRVIAVIAVMGALSGCATVTPSRAGFATPVAAAGVISFKPERPQPPRVTAVNAQVARLLDAQEQGQPEARVAAC